MDQENIDQALRKLEETVKLTSKGQETTTKSIKTVVDFGMQRTTDPIGKLIDGSSRWFSRYQEHRSPGWLTLMGSSGVGKTHIARWIWKNRGQKDVSKTKYVPQYIYMPKLYMDYREEYDVRRMNDFARWPLLVLDEIFGMDFKEWEMKILFTILGQRENKWTVLTTNFNLKQIIECDVRLGDRVIRNPNVYITTNEKSYSIKKN